jgi:hypothetical protein
VRSSHSHRLHARRNQLVDVAPWAAYIDAPAREVDNRIGPVEFAHPGPDRFGVPQDGASARDLLTLITTEDDNIIAAPDQSGSKRLTEEARSAGNDNPTHPVSLPGSSVSSGREMSTPSR